MEESFTTLDLGVAEISLGELVKSLQHYFLPGTYDLLRKNCNSFTDCAMFCLTGGRLDEKYKTLEGIGLAAEKHVSLVSRLTRGQYTPNPKTVSFELNGVISELEQAKEEAKAMQVRREQSKARHDAEGFRLAEFAEVSLVAAGAELKELVFGVPGNPPTIHEESRPHGDNETVSNKAVGEAISDVTPKPKLHVARTLVELGFNGRQSQAAAERHSSVEAAVNWILAQPLAASLEAHMHLEAP